MSSRCPNDWRLAAALVVAARLAPGRINAAPLRVCADPNDAGAAREEEQE